MKNNYRKVYGMSWFIKTLQEKNKVTKLKDRTFGFEFEVNSKDENFYKSATQFFKEIAKTKIYGYPISDFIIAKRDGSLNENKGIEFNTCILAGKEGIEVLTKIVEILNHTFDVDDRCGLHLHIGVNDFNDNDFRNTYYFYQRFQEHFKYYVNKKRLNNHYCKLLSKRTKSDIQVRTCYNLTNDRYKAVNFKSFEDLGTIEFRLLEGTLDINKIITWFNLHTKILGFVKNNPKLMLGNQSIYKLLKKAVGKDMFDDFVERKKYWDYMESDGKCVKYN